MSQRTTRHLQEKLEILDRYERMIRTGDLQAAPATPAAHERPRQHALRRLAQLRQLLLGTLDPAAQREVLDALIEAGIDVGASRR